MSFAAMPRFFIVFEPIPVIFAADAIK